MLPLARAQVIHSAGSAGATRPAPGPASGPLPRGHAAGPAPRPAPRPAPSAGAASARVTAAARRALTSFKEPAAPGPLSLRRRLRLWLQRLQCCVGQAGARAGAEGRGAAMEP